MTIFPVKSTVKLILIKSTNEIIFADVVVLKRKRAMPGSDVWSIHFKNVAQKMLSSQSGLEIITK